MEKKLKSILQILPLGSYTIAMVLPFLSRYIGRDYILCECLSLLIAIGLNVSTLFLTIVNFLQNRRGAIFVAIYVFTTAILMATLRHM